MTCRISTLSPAVTSIALILVVNIKLLFEAFYIWYWPSKRKSTELKVFVDAMPEYCIIYVYEFTSVYFVVPRAFLLARCERSWGLRCSGLAMI